MEPPTANIKNRMSLVQVRELPVTKTIFIWVNSTRMRQCICRSSLQNLNTTTNFGLVATAGEDQES